MLMSLDQVRAFFLAGTVPIPSPFPAVGVILPELFSAKDGSKSKGFALGAVRVEYWQSPRVMIARTVLLEDIQALFLPEDKGGVDLNRGHWEFHPGIEQWLQPLARKNQECKDQEKVTFEGIVFVRENAQVYMQVEVGMTAAESAEYYPPIIRERSDEYYDLHRLQCCR